MIKKVISIMVIVIVIANIALFAFQKINTLLFWLVIVIAAVYAHFIMPKLK
ncbi:hypothetical protein HN592_03195 [Candidatus Woesearchaeota archaeon]|mgnify:CR=1|jgi:hypothetical protein|nr:hypothetical protein [Candidatus Woesearchaeota archaeon]MBT4368218.1 hypothetical protein [Candidatus Woesearchaeota archaeon]MBT4712707.1 hypothetical protein [Candidatus Woesearchaeota archaeon]MBT6639619.1 hypothetical protein [Candidatus Woesearchaeota archaeon]MBT7133791.1 hypothetical protein [Candidatus Woesearchaeota archaeon]